MLDVVIGIVISLFVVLGMREGAAKALSSLAAVFVALFLATASLKVIGQSAPQFCDPNNASATAAFLAIWLTSFIALDLGLSFLLRKIIIISVLGPIDKFGGLAIGG